MGNESKEVTEEEQRGIDLYKELDQGMLKAFKILGKVEGIPGQLWAGEYIKNLKSLQEIINNRPKPGQKKRSKMKWFKDNFPWFASVCSWVYSLWSKLFGG